MLTDNEIDQLLAEAEQYERNPEAVQAKWRKEREIQGHLHEIAKLGVVLLARPEQEECNDATT